MRLDEDITRESVNREGNGIHVIESWRNNYMGDGKEPSRRRQVAQGRSVEEGIDWWQTIMTHMYESAVRKHVILFANLKKINLKYCDKMFFYKRGIL